MKTVSRITLAISLCFALFACDKADEKSIKNTNESTISEAKAVKVVETVKPSAELTSAQKNLDEAGNKFIQTQTALPSNFVEILEFYKETNQEKSEILVTKLLEYRAKKGVSELDDYENNILLQCLRKGYIRYDMLWK